MAASREELISCYFNQGYSLNEIRKALTNRHGHVISLVHLKRLMGRMNLRRRTFDTPIERVVELVYDEMAKNKVNLGQNTMWNHLKLIHGCRVKRETVRRVMQVVDPEGTQLRKAKRLVRRQYSNPGPNFVWHIDGFDKLKPYGFCIHGGIDGYSRKPLWLEVAPTNNNPKAVVTYYLDCVMKIGGAIPRIVRSDLGTENVLVKDLQIYFRLGDDDEMAGLNSFILGRSTSNQRIESFWSILRKMLVNNWIELFKQLRNRNIYNDGNIIHVECLKFCFMDLIQSKLDEFLKCWNLHKPRVNKFSMMPSEKPNILFYSPEQFNGQDMKKMANLDDVRICKELYGYQKPNRGCSDEFLNLVALINPIALTHVPTSFESALDMYGSLLISTARYD